jgi:uncharacterized membrane protein
MVNQVQVLYRTFITSVIFLVWGLACLFFYVMGPVWKGELPVIVIGSSFVVAGTISVFRNLQEILQYKRTGKVKVRVDERVELNILRASKRGFQFLLVSIGILFVLWGARIINDTAFVALMGPVFAVGSVLYLISYYVYERRG